MGAIFGEDVIKESEEEIAKAKAAVTDNRDGKSGELMVKMALIEPNREQPEKILMRNSWLSWLIPSNDTVFCSPF